ncbi:MAG: 50S ribosomal protein L18Ae [Candidatus Bathyarchaeota archaeon]|nr:50S ribosomal protein L18Ae [Candidatus Bathyarchaeota archaeon]
MSVKQYRIKGEINKKKFFEPLTFDKIISAAKQEHAVERIFAEMGSRHRAKRYEITIKSVEEHTPEE